jgi:hypothetical protein
MICVVCGESLEPGALFCPNCGTRVTPAASPTAPTTALPAPVEAAAPTLTQPYDERPTAPQWVVPGQSAPATQWVAPGQSTTSLPNSTPAIVSLIFGILAWLPIAPVVGAIVAVICGHIARRQIKAANGQLGGSGMAMAGLILGYLQLAVLALAICAIVGIGLLSLLGSRVSQ